jgi:hypothetical protein
MNQHLKNHIDKKSIELIGLLDKLSFKKEKGDINNSGSLYNKKVQDLSGKIDLSKPMVMSTTSYNGKNLDKWSVINNLKIGFQEENYVLFEKFLKSIYKDNFIKDLITLDFLETKVFDWLIKTNSSGQATNNLSNYIELSIQESNIKQTYCFPVLNLDIKSEVIIGKTKLKYFTKENFDSLSESYLKKNNNSEENPYERMRDKYQGMVVISIIEKGHPKRAEEKALQKCLLAIDVLKICSDTLELPDLDLSFDIDIRAKEQKNSQCIVHKSNSVEDIIINVKNLPNHHHIDNRYLKRIRDRNSIILTKFISNDEPKNELTNLIQMGITNFAEALSNKDLNKRVVEIFSIYEMLLLPNESSSILESLTKYGPKIVFHKPEDRIHLKKLISDFYGIRSAMIHHGKRKKIDLNGMKQLQIALLQLITNLILKTESHIKKETILTEIDEAINRA